jgi:hypothetical protein
MVQLGQGAWESLNYVLYVFETGGEDFIYENVGQDLFMFLF